MEEPFLIDYTIAVASQFIISGEPFIKSGNVCIFRH